MSLGIDVDAIRKSRAENDVAIGEIVRDPVTLDAALNERRKETVTGTVDVTFDVAADGEPFRRTVVTTLLTVKPDGVSETDRQAVTVERRSVSGSDNR